MLCQKKKSINWLVGTDPTALNIRIKKSDTHLMAFSFCGWAFHKPDKLGICPKDYLEEFSWTLWKTFKS